MNIVFMIIIYIVSTFCYWSVYTITTMGWHRYDFETKIRTIDYKGHFKEFKSLIIPMTIGLILIYILAPIVFL